MADDPLEYQVAKKIVGGLVRAAILAAAMGYVGYVSGKTGVATDKVLDPNVTSTFADAATSVVVSIIAGLISVGWSVREKVVTGDKVESLKMRSYPIQNP